MKRLREVAIVTVVISLGLFVTFGSVFGLFWYLSYGNSYASSYKACSRHAHDRHCRKPFGYEQER